MPTFAVDEVAGMTEPTKAVDFSGAVLLEPGSVLISVRGDVVHIQNAQGQTLEVFDITGKDVAKIAIDSNDKTIDLNLRKGCYILRIGKFTKKIAVS